MEFRWVALIALWTIISGPMFGPPAHSAPRTPERPVAKTAAGTAGKPVARPAARPAGAPR